MADKVDTRVSPALDPETYLAMDGVNDDTRGYINDVVSVLNDTYVTLGKLANARAAADANPAWNESQKVLIVGAEANKQKDRLARRFDRAQADLSGRIAQTEADLLKPVQQAAAGPLAAEVRQHFKGLTGGERSKLIREAMSADDEQTLQAVHGAQPFLSGLSTADRDHYVGLYHAKRQPQVVARLDLMRRVRDKLDTTGANGAVFHRAFERIVGAPPSVASAIDKANQRALDALKIEPAA